MTNIVDARGMACPIPVVKANQALAQMTEGILEVHVDNPVAVENQKRMALQKGLPFKRSSRKILTTWSRSLLPVL